MTDGAIMQRPCPWHRDVLTALVEQARAGRLPHALLLSGVAGIGKLRLARALAQALLCQQPQSGQACGQCHACHLTAAGSHPDYQQLSPEEAGKAIKIDQVRDLVQFGSRTPQYDGYRVAVIAPAHAMNRNAQNALLKTLEEPGERTLLLLVSDQPARLLATVRSRCQQRVLAVPDATQARQWLEEQIGQSERAAALLALAGGAPLQALALDGSDWFAERSKLLNQCLALLAGRQPVSLVAQQFAAQDADGMLSALYSWTHAALAFRARGAEPSDSQLAEGIKTLAQRAGSRRLLTFAEQLVVSRRWLASGSNPNRELLFEQLLLVLVGVDAGVAAF